MLNGAAACGLIQPRTVVIFRNMRQAFALLILGVCFAIAEPFSDIVYFLVSLLALIQRRVFCEIRPTPFSSVQYHLIGGSCERGGSRLAVFPQPFLGGLTGLAHLFVCIVQLFEPFQVGLLSLGKISAVRVRMIAARARK